MKPTQARDYILNMFNEHWKPLGYQAYYQNIDNTVTVVDEPYCTVSVNNIGADRATLTGFNKTSRYRYKGVIHIGLFVPSNTGYDKAYDLGTNILNLYRKPPNDCEINFSDFSMIEESLKYTNFAKLNLFINFSYDYFF